ncbi:Plasmodium exported protein, unknown function [Plasmodium gonderi]|uniref:Uncharacterized protein n=1 Tax=Plasmodium gonderi TaxID=77519 RepID=A0A1Y1JVH9_PLAGO|nr:Plasmodium exported protein, unknown function [Plasmodium gonderi]GAW84732.1 Plasmodium exported protein, unknown function [Plasmodium gonderi]
MICTQNICSKNFLIIGSLDHIPDNKVSVKAKIMEILHINTSKNCKKSLLSNEDNKPYSIAYISYFKDYDNNSSLIRINIRQEEYNYFFCI